MLRALPIRVVLLAAAAVLALAAGCLEDLSGTRCNTGEVCGEGYVCVRGENRCATKCPAGLTACAGGYCAASCDGAGGGTGGGAAGGTGGGTAGGAGGGTAGGTGGGTAGGAGGGGGTLMDAGTPDAGVCVARGSFVAGPSSPATITTLPSTFQWKNTAATQSADGDSAFTEDLQFLQVSDELTVKGLGFTVPANAEVLGLTVTVLRGASALGVGDYKVRLHRTPTQRVEKTPLSGPWPVAMTNATYGGPTDTWGASWTPADVNSADFGFGLVVTNLGVPVSAPRVDRIAVSVTYAVPGTTLGPAAPTVFTSDASYGGTIAWTNPTSAAFDDLLRAGASLTPGSTSHRLQASGITWATASGATVSGIAVEVKRRRGSGGTVYDQALQLLVNGVPSGANRLDGNSWSGTEDWVRYGGVTDTWGTAWTPELVEKTSFGLSLAVRTTASSALAEVNAVRVTVYFDVVQVTVARAGAGLSLPFGRQWTTLLGAQTSGDAVYAAVPGMVWNEVSDFLVASTFGLLVPLDASVTGVQFDVTRKTLSPNNALFDHAVQLMSAGAPVGVNRANPSFWTNAAQTVQYGGPGDTMGTMTLTPAAVNDASFGVGVAVHYRSGSGNDWPQVDGVRMRVYYECP